MSITKPPAIAFFRMYKRLHSIFPFLIEKTNYTFLVDFEIETSAPERFVQISSVAPGPRVNAYAEREFSERRQALFAYLRQGLETLPYADSFSGKDMETFERGTSLGITRLFKYFEIFNCLVEKFDVRSVVLSPSNLIRHQAVVAAAKYHAIPTMHCPHGCFADPDYQFPEPCDYFFMGDRLSAEILKATRASSTRGVITGSPFNVSTIPESEVELAERKTRARSQLGIDPDTNVVLFAMTGFDALNAVFPSSFHTLVESLVQTIQAIKKQIAEGKKYLLLIRQHPSMASTESDIALRSIAAQMDFKEHLRVINDQKEAVLDSANSMVVSIPKSSVVFDAFARALPVLVLDIAPRYEHRFVDTEMNLYVDTPRSDEALQLCLSEHENGKPLSLKTRNAYDFLRKNRLYSDEEAADNWVNFIMQVSEGKRDDFGFEII